MSKVTSNSSKSGTSSNTSSVESGIYDYALNTLASLLPGLNTLDTNTQASIQSQMDAYKNLGIEGINETYNPMITNLENDIASRFGNLDTSIFTDDLGDIESERADAVSSFAQDVLSKQSDLESSALNQKYSLVDLLSGLINDYYDNTSKLADATSTSSSKTTSTKSSSGSSTNSDVTTMLTTLLNNFL